MSVLICAFEVDTAGPVVTGNAINRETWVLHWGGRSEHNDKLTFSGTYDEAVALADEISDQLARCVEPARKEYERARKEFGEWLKERTEQ